MIENLINSMVETKTYCKVLKIGQKTNINKFLSDCSPFVDSKQIRVKQYIDRIEIYLSAKSLEKIKA